MRAPGFWRLPHRTLAALLLTPFSWLYSAMAARRLARAGHRAAVPVICIGNFTAGGAGKTPTAIALAALLRQAGHKPFFLSRGYGGTQTGPLLVSPEHTSAETGDEPLLLARHAPTVVSRDRIAGARLCAEKGATVILMDDGMQNPALAKTLTLAVVDGGTGIGNGLALPAGPLRMAMARQWPLADAVLIIGQGEAGDRVAAAATDHGKPVFRAWLRPDAAAAGRLKGQKALAFAGIGHPEKFFETLRAVGANPVRERAFADHHAFSEDELTALLNQAEKEGLVPVTTEKDYTRIPMAARATGKIEVLPVELVFSAGDMGAWIAAGLRR